MTNGSVLNNNMYKTMLYRTFTANGSLSSTLYTAPSVMRVGVGNDTPLISDTVLDYEVPIGNGSVIFQCNSAFTGATGGDNSTDNTTTYKEGAGVTDNKSQNLIANGTNASKIWYKTGLTITKTQYYGLWLYIKDSTTLAKFKSSSTALEIRFRTDSSNYYSQTFTASQLAVGWNWITSNKTTIQSLTATGSPGTCTEFYIIITTNNATDTFIAGDVCIDLIRSWQISDLNKAITVTIDYDTLNVTSTATVNSLEANGFLINGSGIYNADTTPLLLSEDTFDGYSKSSTDELIFEFVDRRES